MKKSLYLIAICLFSGFFAQAQKNLVLENPNKLKRILYISGSPIKLQLKGDKIKVTGLVESVNDSMLIIVRAVKMANSGDATNQVLRDYILLRDIRTVYKRPSGSYGEYFVGMAGGGLTLAGLAFTVILPIDAAIAKSDVDRTNFAIGLSMLVTGALLLVTRRNKLRMGKKWKVRAMNPFIEEILD